MSGEAPRLLRNTEARHRLGMSRQTFYEYRKKGYFPAVVLGPNMLRWRSTDVDEWVKRGIGKAKDVVLAERTETQLAVARRKDRR